MREIIRIRFKEISEARGRAEPDSLSLRELTMTLPQDHEQEIISYLEKSPCYVAAGMVVHDALDPGSREIIYPGANTDGLYVWPSELAYYVRKYHIRLPQDFLERMASLNWSPPPKSAIDFKKLYAGFAS